MLRNEYTNTLEKLKATNPEDFAVLQAHTAEQTKEASTISHTSRNMISFINCSYQFITEVHPEAKNFEYWNDIQSTLSQLIDYTNRTSSYRYSFYEPEMKVIELSTVLHSLPDSLKAAAEEMRSDIYSLSLRSWNYDLDPGISTILTDKYQLKAALLELIKNGLEATPLTSPITICSRLLSEHSCSISISYESDHMDVIQEHSQQELAEPFFTTKPDHTGLGLSIVNNICQKLQARYILSTKGNQVINTIELSL